jgi:hypothetical protein
MICFCRYKHQAFKEEKEIRIVGHLFNKGTSQKSSVVPLPDKPVKKGICIGSKKERIELNKDNCDVLPITKIVISPGPDQEKHKSYFERLRDKQGLKFAVNISATPYNV